MKKNNKLVGWIILMYLGFFGLIAFAIWISQSIMPLWALLLIPSASWGKDDAEEWDENF